MNVQNESKNISKLINLSDRLMPPPTQKIKDLMKTIKFAL
jgi:hypothetical protein